MSRITHLDNGATIKADVVESFDKAIMSEENIFNGIGTTNFWNYVESDMYMDLSGTYANTYIDECFEKLANIFENNA